MKNAKTIAIMLITLLSTTAAFAGSAPHKLYRAGSVKTWTSISQAYYGNSQYASEIANYRSNSQNHGQKVSANVVFFLPKELSDGTKLKSRKKQRDRWSFIDGNAKIERRHQTGKKNSIAVSSETTFYDCDGNKSTDENVHCSGLNVYAKRRDEERIDKDANSQLTRLRIGPAWRQYGKTKGGTRYRDTQKSGFEGIRRNSESYKPSKGTRRERQTTLAVHGGLERKNYWSDKWATKIGIDGRVPFAVLDHHSDYDNDPRDEASVGIRGEVQYRASDDWMFFGKLGLWHGFNGDGTTTLTPIIGARWRDMIEAGIGVELQDAKSPTDIVYARVLFEKLDRRKRQESHRVVPGHLDDIEEVSLEH